MKRLAEMSQRGHDINEKKIKGRGVKDVEKKTIYIQITYQIFQS